MELVMMVIASTLAAAAPSARLDRGAPSRTVNAFGMTWAAKRGWGGPGPNVWSDDQAAVFVDRATGALHLRAIATQARKSSARVFNCSEVALTTPLGFGTYEWDVVGDASALGGADPHVVLGMFLYKNDTEELDIELARWGNSSTHAHNADFVNQPGTGAGNRGFWTLPPGHAQTTYRIQWNATAVVWTAFSPQRSGQPFAQQVSRSNVPADEEGMLVHLNLWMFQGKATAIPDVIEVIFSGFRFTSAG